jgi:hypothetical protein
MVSNFPLSFFSYTFPETSIFEVLDVGLPECAEEHKELKVNFPKESIKAK